MACCMTVEVASLAAIRNADGLAGTIAVQGVSGPRSLKTSRTPQWEAGRFGK